MNSRNETPDQNQAVNAPSQATGMAVGARPKLKVLNFFGPSKKKINGVLKHVDPQSGANASGSAAFPGLKTLSSAQWLDQLREQESARRLKEQQEQETLLNAQKSAQQLEQAKADKARLEEEEKLLLRARRNWIQSLAEQTSKPAKPKSPEQIKQESIQKVTSRIDHAAHIDNIGESKQFVQVASPKSEPMRGELDLQEFFKGARKGKLQSRMDFEHLEAQEDAKRFARLDPVKVLKFQDEPIQNELLLDEDSWSEGLGEDLLDACRAGGFKTPRVAMPQDLFKLKAVSAEAMVRSWKALLTGKRSHVLVMQPDYIRMDEDKEVSHELFVSGAYSSEIRSSLLLKTREDAELKNDGFAPFVIHLYRPKVLLDSHQSEVVGHPVEMRNFDEPTFSGWFNPSEARGFAVREATQIESYLYAETKKVAERFKTCLLDAFKLAKALQVEGVALDTSSLCNLSLGMDQKSYIFERYGVMVVDSITGFLATPYEQEDGQIVSLAQALCSMRSIYEMCPGRIHVSNCPSSILLAHLLGVIAEKDTLSLSAYESLGMLDLLTRRAESYARVGEKAGGASATRTKMGDLKLWLLAEQQKMGSYREGSHHFLMPAMDVAYVYSKDKKVESFYSVPGVDCEMRPVELLNLIRSHFAGLRDELSRQGLWFLSVERFMRTMVG